MKPCFALLVVLLAFASCRQEELIPLPEEEPTLPPPPTGSVEGFYLLNVGNMGMNKATLDYWDGATGTYHRNIYAAANPDVPMALGDVGNELVIYGSRLYAIINCSNKVEVMDVATARRAGKIDIPNCRFIAFEGRYAYVTSYAGPVQIEENYRQRGYVAKIDTATLAVVDTVLVGYQPDGIDIINGKAYVANSGGYMVPRYERTVSVIDLAAMKVERTFDVGINLNFVKADSRGMLWVTSRGDYYETTPRLYCIDPESGEIAAELQLGVSSMWLDDGRLYIVATEWSYLTMRNEKVFAVVDTETRSILTRNFITDGTESSIRIPYCVAVNPVTKEIFVSDAVNYTSPGNLHCYSPEGVRQWTVRTGDIPGHIAFVEK